MYGIEDPTTGNIDVWNNGELFGAIDVALFILVIGGFLGVTMKTGAIQAGIARARASGCTAASGWMIPILMIVFAIGGTTYGMAEESLAFYVLIITVMIAAGYDALVGRARCSSSAAVSACSARRSTRSPPASPPASPTSPSTDGLVLRLVILVVGLAIGIWFVHALRRRGCRPTRRRSLVYDRRRRTRRTSRRRSTTAAARSS